MRYGKDGEDRYHEDRYPESKFKIGEKVMCHSDKCYRKIKKNIEIEKQKNYKTSVLTIEEIYYDNKKYTYKVSHITNTPTSAAIFEENDLTKYIHTSKTRLNLNDDVWNPNRKEFIVFAHGSECFQDTANNDSVIEELSTKYSENLQNYFTKNHENPMVSRTITEILMKVFNINFPSEEYHPKVTMNHEMIFDALVYITFGCQKFFGKTNQNSQKRFLCNFNKNNQKKRNFKEMQNNNFNWEKHSRVLNFFPETFHMNRIYGKFGFTDDGEEHRIRVSVMNDYKEENKKHKSYLQLQEILKKLKSNLPTESEYSHDWLSLLKKRIKKEKKEKEEKEKKETEKIKKNYNKIFNINTEELLPLTKKNIEKEKKLDKQVKKDFNLDIYNSYLTNLLNKFTNVFLEQTKQLTISKQHKNQWKKYLFGVHKKAIPIIKKLRTLPFKLLRDVPLLPNETVIIKCAPGCTLTALMGEKRVKLLKDAKNLKEFLLEFNKDYHPDMCMFKGSVPNLNLTFFQKQDKKNVGGFGLYELPLNYCKKKPCEKWCLNKTPKGEIIKLVRCSESSNDDKLYWQTENSYLDKNKPGAKSDVTEVIKKIREKYKENSEIILYINSCRTIRLCSVEKDKDKKTDSYSVIKIN